MHTSSQRKCQCTLAYNTCVRLACLDSTDRQHNHSHALLSMQLQSKEMLYPEYPIFLNNHVLHAMKGVNRDCLLPIWLLTIEQVEQFFVWHNVSIAALKLTKLTTPAHGRISSFHPAEQFSFTLGLVWSITTNGIMKKRDYMSQYGASTSLLLVTILFSALQQEDQST